MQIITPLCVQHKYAYLNIQRHRVWSSLWVWRIWWFCGYGDSVGIPTNFSVDMGWVWGLKSNPHGSPALYFTMGAPFPKITPSHGEIWTPCNTWFIGPIRAQNSNDIAIGSAVFAQMTAECSYTFAMGHPFPSWKLPLPMGDLDPHLINGSLGPP